MLDTLKTHILDTTEKLIKSGLKLATAESCTGGGLCYWLTSVPGSSEWIDRGFITYSNDAKVQMLDVPMATITACGAVSKETAMAMAAGALKNSKADIAISITGIAGPDGGTPEKPVGTVWIGYASRQQTPDAKLHTFEGDRQSIRLQAIIAALRSIISM